MTGFIKTNNRQGMSMQTLPDLINFHMHMIRL